MKEFLIGKNGFATFEEAFAAAREAVDGNEKEPVTFRVAGEVALTAPVVIENDRLFNGREVLFDGGSGAVVTGGVTVSGFERWRENIYRVHIPRLTYTRTLYLDGKFAPRPATEKTASFGWDKAKGSCDFYREGDRVTGLVTTDRSLLGWTNVRDVEMIFNVGWTHHIIPIEAVRELPDGRVFIQPLEIPFRTSQRPQGVEIGGCPTCYENVFERLGNPGEWYFDRRERMLYLALADGDRPENHTVEVPLTEFLLRIAGTVEAKISNVGFRNLTFRNTTFLRPNLYGHSDLQAGFAREESDAAQPARAKPYELDGCKLPGTLRVLAAENIRFEGCRFTCLDSTALCFEYGAENCLVRDCTFGELGAGALQLGDVFSDRSHHPTDARETVRNITLENSSISETGRDFFSTVAVLLGYVSECNVVHNDIANVPYSAVSVGWGWGHSDVSVGPYRPTPWTTPSVSGKNNISFNHIHHCMMTLYDGGAIYTLGAMEGTRIEGNYIHHSGGYDGMGCDGLAASGYHVEGLGLENGKRYAGQGPFPGGIYLDEGSRGIEVCGNVIFGAVTPLFYHNQIDDGLRYVRFHDNVLNLRPKDEGFPTEIQKNAGRK